MKRFLCMFLLTIGICMAQSSTSTEELVTVPKKYVSAEGLQNQSATSAAATASTWVGFGREVGQAFKEGLSAVVNEAEHFGRTNVGTFVMVMIAWKVMGKDMVNIVFGIPIFIAGVGLWVWSLRRFFFTRRILIKHDKANKVKTWAETERYPFEKDGRAVCGAVHGGFLLLWCFAGLLIIF